MRDVSAKVGTLRTATARAVLRVSPETVDRIRRDDLPKANPLEMAEFAGIQGAKNTPLLIPYCHTVPLSQVTVHATLQEETIEVIAKVKAVDRTGVEMEALTGASVAVLTLYDMLKIIDQNMRIEGIDLLEKTGGKSDRFAQATSFLAAVVVIGDSVVAGTRVDETGPILREELLAWGATEVKVVSLADERERIVEAINLLVDEAGVAVVLTTGGTGVGPRDVTPEAMDAVFDREAPGIAEAIRAYGRDRNRLASLSRGRAGTRKEALIVNLPGSVGGVRDGLCALQPLLGHAIHIAKAGGHE